jgi:primase-polymerase (primpol)-like protein
MMPDVNPDGIPAQLKDRRQWICWTVEDRDGKPTKAPVQPGGAGYADVTDPETWTTFEAALDYLHESASVAGLGYVFTADGPYAGVDLDDCRDPETGDLPDLAREIVDRLDSYTEVSPSGTGVHVLIAADLPEGRNRRGSVELYDRDRFFTVTGEHVEGTPATVEERGEALAAVHETYIADSGRDEPSSPPEPSYVDLADETLVDRAMNAANGRKFERLWNGNVSGYESHSEADQALANMLAFWTGGDRERVERLFDQSGLTRAKWWERPDYRRRTIENAVQGTTEFYEPQDVD